jgi:hypothetical protein
VMSISRPCLSLRRTELDRVCETNREEYREGGRERVYESVRGIEREEGVERECVRWGEGEREIYIESV